MLGHRRFETCTASVGLVCLLAAGWSGVGFGMSACIAGDDDQAVAESDARIIQREENMQAMLRRARATRVRLVADDVRTDATLIARPLFHYNDQPRRIIDATLWGWTRQGRLVAVCKIEKYDHPPERTWLYCFGSLATGLIEAEWADGSPWSAKQPGVEFQPIDGGPRPPRDPAGRLRQMKEQSTRFQATILVDDVQNNTQEMRLLTRPIFRYEKPEGKLLDGAVFGLTTNGTNPDALLVIELHELENGSSQWMFAIAGMTAGGLTLKLDDKEVWTKPFVGNTGRYDTWLWFFGKPDDER